MVIFIDITTDKKLLIMKRCVCGKPKPTRPRN